MSEIIGDVVPDNGPSEPASTGHGGIDEAIARLDRLDELPVDAHPEIFDEIHTGLRDALANAGRDEDPSAAS
ncbi:MAG: hypothetical protein M3Q98_03660 [Actinomycetota bacterium]|nr:hypothetical protein [Actinomycetota bacterium]